MSPGSVSCVVVADKVAAVQRMLDGIRTLPLDNLAAFTADGRKLFAILTGELGDIEAVIAGVTRWLADHPDRVRPGD